MTTPVKFSSGIPNADYPIVVGLDIGKEFKEMIGKLGSGKRVVVVSDTTVGPRWSPTVLSLLAEAEIEAKSIHFEAGEKNKNQQSVTVIQDVLLKDRYGRDTLILALGGGVVGDVVGYVAATFLRGVPYVQVPTTLLSMVDSSIGGKVGIDTPYGKNTVGAFWQPSAVIADMRFLESLPPREFTSGLLEAIKDFFTADESALKSVDAISVEDPLSTADALQETIVRAIKFKCGVVSRDEREENERRILNFGHTVGHAIELLSGYAMPHGFAVGLGMLVETKIAEDLGVLTSSDRAVLVEHLARLGVHATALKEFDVEKALEAMKGDKKTKGGTIYCVLLNGIGSVSNKDGQYAHRVEETVVKKAYQNVVNNT